MPIIQVRELVKEFRAPRRPPGLAGTIRALLAPQYDTSRALDRITFSIEEGESVGYIGPNGAGKSTTIKLLTGILVPTGGLVEVAGRVPWRERERNALSIGVVFGTRTQLWWDLPLVESFELVRCMYHVPYHTYRKNLEQFSASLELSEFLARPVRQLSLGQRMRGDLVAALLHEPQLLYLDEPTVGLDILAKERIRSFIEEINRSGRTTVLLATHDLADVERLCRRIILIDHGRVLFDGQIERLRRRYAPHRILVVKLTPDARESPTIELRDAESISREGLTTRLRFDPTRVSARDLILSVAERYRIADVAIAEPSLEDVIRAIYEKRQPSE